MKFQIKPAHSSKKRMTIYGLVQRCSQSSCLEKKHILNNWDIATFCGCGLAASPFERIIVVLFRTRNAQSRLIQTKTQGNPYCARDQFCCQQCTRRQQDGCTMQSVFKDFSSAAGNFGNFFVPVFFVLCMIKVSGDTPAGHCGMLW